MNERERFWSHVNVVDDDDSCWPWTASTNAKGYGRFQLRLRGGVMLAHRFAFVDAGHTLSPDQCVLHRCDNPPCCRPDHLYAGDRRDNARDAYARGQMKKGSEHPMNRKPELRVYGERHGMCRHSAETVSEIRRLHGLGVRNVDIASRLGLSSSYVCMIVKGRARTQG